MERGGRQTDSAVGNGARRKAWAVLAALVGAVVALLVWRPASLDLWVKTFHIVAVIAWMAGLLYLPRLFVYHTDAEIGSVQSETFKVMESRLLTVIMRPAMTLTWLLGLWLAYSSFGFVGGWLWAKILAVIALTGVHVAFSRAARAFNEDRRERPARHWRLMNEVPTVLMVVIVILVVVKPF